MSHLTVKWAMKLPIKRSSAKFVLVVMAELAREENAFKSWPSIQYLSDATSLDRKTVLQSVKSLLEEGYIVDTGIRTGRTGQIIVYQLKFSVNGTVEVTEHEENRNSTENGTAPKTDANRPVFHVKEDRFSVQTVTKTGHGTRRNQKKPEENSPGASGTRLPTEWILTDQFHKEALAINPTWTTHDIQWIGDKFKDHWIAVVGDKACSDNWMATWRNWCRNEKPMLFGNKAKGSCNGWRTNDKATLIECERMGITPLVGESMYLLRERMTAAKENGGIPPIKSMSRIVEVTEPQRAKGTPPDLSAVKALLAAHKGLLGASKSSARPGTTH